MRCFCAVWTSIPGNSTGISDSAVPCRAQYMRIKNRADAETASALFFLISYREICSRKTMSRDASMWVRSAP